MPKRSAAKKKILLVGTSRKDYRNALKRKGYDVEGPLDFAEARFRCVRVDYDLVLLDIALDPHTAMQVCGQIRRCSPRSYMVFVLDSPPRIGSITCPPDDVVHPEQGVEHLLQRVRGLLAA